MKKNASFEASKNPFYVGELKHVIVQKIQPAPIKILINKAAIENTIPLFVLSSWVLDFLPRQEKTIPWAAKKKATKEQNGIKQKIIDAYPNTLPIVAK